MSFSPIPDHCFDKLTDISPEFLQKKGISLLLLDLDNTISPYGIDVPTEAIIKWSEDMKSKGIKLYIVSNNRSSQRAGGFAEKMGISFVYKAGKPSTRGVLQAMKQEWKKPCETALAGDQVYTDVLAANRSGITSLLIKPISLKNPLLAVRYVFEIPFRILCKEFWLKK